MSVILAFIVWKCGYFGTIRRWRRTFVRWNVLSRIQRFVTGLYGLIEEFFIAWSSYHVIILED